MARKFKADIRRNATCGACETGYYYFHSVELDEYDSDKFDAKVRDAVQNGVGVAPCPACGALNPEMKKAHLKGLQTYLLGGLGSVVLLLFCWMMASEGALFYVLIPVGALALLGSVAGVILWIFEPWTNRKHSIIPGQEDQASQKAREQLAAWRAAGPGGPQGL